MSYSESFKRNLEEKGIDVAEPRDRDYRNPNLGGCWICLKGNGFEDDDMLLDMEFDTYYHSECLEKTGADSILEFERGDYL